MRRSHILISLVFLLLFVALVASNAPVYSQEDPATITGVLRYKERGPGASPTGIANALLVGGVGAPVAIVRLSNAIDLLTMVPPLNENPSMKSVSEFLRDGVPIDLAQAFPIVASYDAEVRFTLEQAELTTFTLQQGTVSWSSDNSTELGYDEGRIVDNFRGAGTHLLDPATSDITLTYDLSTDPARFTFEVDVSHPMPLDGKSRWTWGDDIAAIEYEEHGEQRSWGGHSLGIPLSAVGLPTDPEEYEPFQKTIAYVRQNDITVDFTEGVETWRTLLDGHAVMEYGLYERCQAHIQTPAENDEWIFDDSDAGVLEGEVRARVEPAVWAGELEWTFPELEGSTLTTEPASRRGPTVKFRYEKLPPDNNTFGEKEIRAAFTQHTAECEDPEPRPVKVFFSRDASNNPDGSVPNWFYYWKQSSAGQGHGNAIRYDPACDSDEEEVTLGHFDGYLDSAKDKHIYICNLATNDFETVNGVFNTEHDGIDAFGALVRHEWAHLSYYQDWWAPDGYAPERDEDIDTVPDAKEPALGFDHTNPDTFLSGYDDEHYLVYKEQNTWPNGSVDAEDWAYPGKQGGGE